MQKSVFHNLIIIVKQFYYANNYIYAIRCFNSYAFIILNSFILNNSIVIKIIITSWHNL